MTALSHGQCYMKCMAQTYSKKVKPRSFKEGDLVFTKIIASIEDPRGKFIANFEGLMS